MRFLSRTAGHLSVLLTRAAHRAGTHTYLSTSCLHGRHSYCSAPRGSTYLSGTEETWKKKPSTCKFCSAACACRCHRTSSPKDYDVRRP